MRTDDRIRLRHMIEAAESAVEFMTGRERADLDSDRMLLFAVVRAIEILGEAASRISTETQATSPEIPWRAIIGMRHRLIHAYFAINTTMVWQTVTRNFPCYSRSCGRWPLIRKGHSHGHHQLRTRGQNDGTAQGGAITLPTKWQT